jgi:PHD/YefM family antitoxin component YafN of YafNO toxin-antitoxin module
MISVTVSEFSKQVKTLLDLVELKGEEIVLLRDQQEVARITPKATHMTALEAMSDIYKILPKSAAEGWEAECRAEGRLNDVVNPWE